MWYSFNYGLVHFVQFDTEVGSHANPSSICSCCWLSLVETLPHTHTYSMDLPLLRTEPTDDDTPFAQTDFPNAPLATKGPDLPCGDFGPGGALLKWLEADLAAVRALCLHHPPLTAAAHLTFMCRCALWFFCVRV